MGSESKSRTKIHQVLIWNFKLFNISLEYFFLFHHYKYEHHSTMVRDKRALLQVRHKTSDLLTNYFPTI